MPDWIMQKHFKEGEYNLVLFSQRGLSGDKYSSKLFLKPISLSPLFPKLQPVHSWLPYISHPYIYIFIIRKPTKTLQTVKTIWIFGEIFSCKWVSYTIADNHKKGVKKWLHKNNIKKPTYSLINFIKIFTVF